jgi:D-alanine-D-alanine ligase-like ATP-grasp enzyme
LRQLKGWIRIAIQVLTTLNIDVMVPQMFCIPGMTYYRSLFDLLNIPYVGNTPDVMALTANKAKAKAVVAAAGVKVQLVCLPLEEYSMDKDQKPIRNYSDKISQNQSGDLNLVAKDTTKAWIVNPDDPLTEKVWDAAKKCHTALGCRHYSLFDFRIDPNGHPCS